MQNCAIPGWGQQPVYRTRDLPAEALAIAALEQTLAQLQNQLQQQIAAIRAITDIPTPVNPSIRCTNSPT